MPSINLRENVFQESNNRQGYGTVTNENRESIRNDVFSSQESIGVIKEKIAAIPLENGMAIFYLKYNRIPPKTKRINFRKINATEDIPQIGSHLNENGKFKIYYKLLQTEFDNFYSKIERLENVNLDDNDLGFFLLLKEVSDAGRDIIESPLGISTFRLLPIEEYISIIVQENIYLNFEEVSNVITITPEQFDIINARFPGLIFQSLTLSSFSIPEIDFELDDENVSIDGDPVATIGVIDSFNNLAGDFERFILLNSDRRETSGREPNHGSMVGSLIIANDEINPTAPDGLGNFNIKHFEVMSPSVQFYYLGDLLKELIPNHPEIKVWNLSLGALKSPYSRSISPIGKILDTLSKENGVLFVIAAGNERNDPSALGENLSLNMPADSLNAISVGSVSMESGTLNRATYSSFGPILHYEKPEISHFGGPQNYDGSPLSVFSSSIVTGLGGTSFSAPRVSRMAAYLMENDYSAEEAKAKIIISAKRETATKKSSAFGYLDGKLDNFDLKTDLNLIHKKPQFLPIEIPTAVTKIGLSVSHLVWPLSNLGEEYSIDNVEISLAWVRNDAEIKTREKFSRKVSEASGDSRKSFVTEGNLRFDSGKYFNSHTTIYSSISIERGRRKAVDELGTEDLSLFVRVKKLNLFDLELPLKVGIVIQLEGERAYERFIQENLNVIDISNEVEIDT